MPDSTIEQDASVDTRAGFRSDTNCHSYFQLNVTLDVTYKAEGWRDTDDVLSWLNGCLNCNPNHAEVKISNPTSFLCWTDFIDIPMFGEEHPDYPATVDLLNRIESWLKLDREALITELHRQHLAAEYEKVLQADAAVANAKKAKALDDLLATLEGAGFGSNDAINGGDCVELIDRIYKKLVAEFPR